MDGRANPVPEREAGYAGGMLSAVVRYFGARWLTEIGSNPIQVLWKREDGFATSELMMLGGALQKMEKQDAKWVKLRVQAAKSRRADTRIGDLFELVGLSNFCCRLQTVLPAREGQPGYDGTIILPNGAVIYVSMKNYAATTHELHFLKRSAFVEARFLAELERRKMTGLSLIAFASTYPQETDWKALEGLIPFLVTQSNPKAAHSGNWAVNVGNVPAGEGRLLPHPLSYQTSIFAPYHANEKQNLISRLAEAAANFEKHASHYSEPMSYRLLYIRIHEVAPMKACADWCQEYLNNYPDTPIDKILLYQPAIVQFTPENDTAIAHHIAILDRTGNLPFIGKDGTSATLNIETIIGRPSSKPSSLKLVGFDAELSDTYAFQHGNVYRSALKEADGSSVGYMKILGPGILQHSLINIEGSSLLISGKYQSSNELLLFT